MAAPAKAATAAAERRVAALTRHCTGAASGAGAGAGGASRAPLLDGDVAIVTGSGQGIGEAVARLFAREGAAVVVSDLDATKSDAVAASIVADGGRAISVPGDVTEPDFGTKIVEATVAKYGKLNHIVNNAGYTWDGVVHRMSDKQWTAMQDVHTMAPFRIIRAAAKHFRTPGSSENRSIVNISSTSGLHGNAGQVNYSTAKLGVVGLTKTVAKEWGRFGVRCNAVAFGFVETRLTAKGKSEIEVKGNKVKVGLPESQREMATMFIPLGRAGKPDEAASAVLFLASPLASFVTGHCLECTGGQGI